MANNSKNGLRTANIGAKLFRFLLIILSVILVVMIIITFNVIGRKSYTYTADPDDMLRQIKNGYYPDAVMDMYDNIALGETPEKNTDYMIPYAILEYYEASSLYKGYINAAASSSDPARKEELTEAAESCRSDMEHARSRMGELEFFTSEIDDIFMSD